MLTVASSLFFLGNVVKSLFAWYITLYYRPRQFNDSFSFKVNYSLTNSLIEDLFYNELFDNLFINKSFRRESHYH